MDMQCLSIRIMAVAFMGFCMLGAATADQSGTAATVQNAAASPTTTASTKADPKPAFARALDTGGKLFNGGFIQDREGFFWIATLSGLYKWDGYTLKKPKGSPDAIYAIYEDSEGLIWVSSSVGLSRYDKSVDALTAYRHDPNNPKSIGEGTSVLDMHSIAEDSTGNIWFGTEKGLNRYDKQTKAFTVYTHDPSNANSLGNDHVSVLHVDRQGTLWFGTEGGLDKFNPTTATFAHYQNQPDNPNSLSSNNVTALLEDHNGVLWVGTKDGGINRFDQSSGSFTRYLNDPNNLQSLRDNYVFSASEVNDDEIWITHWDNVSGLEIFDTKTGVFHNYRYDQNNPSSESYNQIANVYKDRLGIVWVIHFNGVLEKIDPANTKFAIYQHRPNDSNSLAENGVFNVYQDKQGMIWISLTTKGLDKFDPHTKTFIHYPDMPGGLAQSTVEDDSGVFWMAGTGGIFTFDKKTGKYSEVYTLECKSGQVIVADRNNADILWVGTDLGLVKFNRTTKKWIKFRHDPNNPDSISNDYMWNLFMDKAGFIWIPTYGGGLDKFDPKTEKVVMHYKNDPHNPKSLGSDTLNHVYGDSAGHLWIGTVESGLNRLNPDGSFTRYNEETGFITNWVGGIIEDNQGFLWLNAKIGLIKFDPKTETWRLYTQDDGLQSNEFLEYPNYKAPDGELWVYGPNGLNSFYPDKLKDNPYKPSVFFTSLSQGNEPLKDVKQAPERVKDIILDWQSNYFEFEVAALNFTRPERNQYQYFLDGFDKQWYNAGTKRTGRYSNLPSGTYTLRVRGSNNDGLWGDRETALTITVTPPWWETWEFRILAAVALLALAVGGYRLRVRSIVQRSRELERQVGERTRELQIAKDAAEKARQLAEVANGAKSVFLAHMSHELRTPLNGILGYADILAGRAGGDRALREGLEIIRQSGDHLLTLINDVLDLVRIETGKIELHPTQFALARFLGQIIAIMRARAEAKQLALTTEELSPLPAGVLADETRLRQVLLNLLGNAVKFTDRGQVSLSVEVVKRTEAEAGEPQATLRFSVKDSGPGTAPEQLQRIFEPFEQAGRVDRRAEGAGLGLAISRQIVQQMGGRLQVQSTVGRGSIFWFDVILPVMALAAQEAPMPAHNIIGYEGARRCILVVDDKDYNRQVFHDLLEPVGFVVHSAGDGQQAITKAAECHPDAILMDQFMPVMSGSEAVQAIRQRSDLKEVVIIAISASVLEADQEKSLGAGCNAFLPKPVRREPLLMTLATHLGLTWVYAEPQHAPEAPDALLIAPPAEELRALYQFARSGRLIEIRAATQRIAALDARYKPFAERVYELSREVDLARIIALVEQFMPKEAQEGGRE